MTVGGGGSPSMLPFSWDGTVGEAVGDAVGLVQPSTFVALHLVSPSSGP
eukprot:CAMPEP_0202801544 /NCGR_PEP_ID=MMETSP1388-20130828/102192_1 /ASSEMBLY_ACC=CAM_ASM_000864 /TAXON_ID=37098 /ORGANISM="Isochrysis sp, Strain CCMP1244" /LENGTH=48 /DNA_ID= /DNA_START= /DNA_END= /DNA_ORIENTATION=